MNAILARLQDDGSIVEVGKVYVPEPPQIDRNFRFYANTKENPEVAVEHKTTKLCSVSKSKITWHFETIDGIKYRLVLRT